MLVDYSDSDDDEQQVDVQSSTAQLPPALPALPSTFLDLYSSTVRASTQDDPSLHGGRIRTVPHIEGNWPVHLYLEWIPNARELETLTAVLALARADDQHDDIRSLLLNELGVHLPLHVSMSRPLVLRTEQKDKFLSRIRAALAHGGLRVAITAVLQQLRWHPNEDGSRDFLVLQLEHDQQLSSLLQLCNSIAADFNQPLLYVTDDISTQKDHDQFHVSIAWSLPSRASSDHVVELPDQLAQQLKQLHFNISELKVRIGQDVTTLPLGKKTMVTSSLFS